MYVGNLHRIVVMNAHIGLAALGCVGSFAMQSARSAATKPAESAAPIMCEGMAALAIPNVRITAAEAIMPAPQWTSPDTVHLGSASVQKAFCRIRGVIESEIRFEFWLFVPSAWNGKYLGAGNGAMPGSSTMRSWRAA